MSTGKSPLRTCSRAHSVAPYSLRRWGSDVRRGAAVEGGRALGAGRAAGALVVCLALLLAACSSDSDSPNASGVTETPPETSAAPTTTPESTATTTSTEAPSATTTTVDPRVAVEAEVRAATIQAIDDFSACLVAMPNWDTALLAATRADPLLTVNVDRVVEWNAAGYTVTDRDQFRYVIEAVDLAASLDQATVTVCFADGSKLVEPGAGPGGVDVIIDGEFVSGREAWEMGLEGDGVWRARNAPLVGETEATDVCPAG